MNTMNYFNYITDYKYISGVNGNIIKKHKIINRVFPFCVVVYVEKGEFFVETDDRTYDISEGETIFIPSFLSHAVGSLGDSVVTYAHFLCNFLNIDVMRFAKTNCFTVKNDNIHKILKEMNASALLGGFIGKIGTDKAISELVILLVNEGVIDVSYTDIDLRLHKVLEYINNNATTGITVEEIVELSGYSKTMFYQMFTESMHITPHKYIECERMKQTLFLLSEGKKVKEAAAGGGYIDEVYFAKKFKKHFGITPKQYRKILKEQWR